MAYFLPANARREEYEEVEFSFKKLVKKVNTTPIDYHYEHPRQNKTVTEEKSQ